MPTLAEELKESLAKSAENPPRTPEPVKRRIPVRQTTGRRQRTEQSGAISTAASEAGRAFAGLGVDFVSGLEELVGAADDPGSISSQFGETFSPQSEGAAATVGQAIGGVAPSFLIGAVGTALGGPVAGIGAVIAAFASANFGRAFREARKAGLDEDRQLMFATLNAGLAGFEAIPVFRTLRFLNRGTGGLVGKFARRGGQQSIQGVARDLSRSRSGRTLLAVLQAAPEEAVQESFLSQVPENFLTKAFGVDPERGLFEGAGRAALLGAIGGGVGAAAISPFTQGPTDAFQDQKAGGPDANVRQFEGAVEGQGQVSEQVGGEGVRQDGQAQPSEELASTIAQSQANVTDTISDTGGQSEIPPPPPIDSTPDSDGVSPEGTNTTQIRKEDLAKLADELGVSLEEITPTSDPATRQAAIDAGFDVDAVKISQNILAQHAAGREFVTSAKLQAGLRERLAQLKKSKAEFNARKRISESDAEINRLQAEIDRIVQDQTTIARAEDVVRSASGSALRQGRIGLTEDFELFMILKSAEARKGAPLTPEERAGFEELSEGLEVMEEDLVRLKDRLDGIDQSTDTGRRSAEGLRVAIEEAELDIAIRQQEIINATQKMRPLTLMDRIGELFNISRTILVSLDLSGVLRQGGKIGLANPSLIAKNFGPMLKAMTDERTSFRIQRAILADPVIQELQKNGLHISDLFGTGLSKQEEAYMRRTGLDRVPVVRGLVRASERAFVTFLNLMRAQSAKRFVEATRNGEPTQPEMAGIANAVNVLTGRGDLGRFNKNATFLSTILFAPRYVVSQFQTLTLNPIRKAGSGGVALLIAGQYARMLASFSLLVALAAMAGFDIEYDRRSSDFMKLRHGKTRVDIGTGLIQPIVLISRIQTGESKSPVTGRVARLRGPRRGPNRRTFGRGVPQELARFVRTKLSPANAIAIDIMAGENVIGDEVTVKTVDGVKQLGLNQLMPISVQEILDLLKERENMSEAAAFGALSILGAGVATFDKKTPAPQRR